MRLFPPHAAISLRSTPFRAVSFPSGEVAEVGKLFKQEFYSEDPFAFRVRVLLTYMLSPGRVCKVARKSQQLVECRLTAMQFYVFQICAWLKY